MIQRLFVKFFRLVWFFINHRKFKLLRNTSAIQKNIRFDGKKGIELHDDVIIQRGSWLAAVPLTGKRNALLKICEGTVVGNYNHIYATSSIIIEKNVLLADKVYISDCSHSYENISLPIIDQPIKQLKEVIIGEGSWLGENVCVMGASIGKHCVIGANSVVTKDIPAYSIAVGSPAKVIKRYNQDTQKWERC